MKRQNQNTKITKTYCSSSKRFDQFHKSNKIILSVNKCVKSVMMQILWQWSYELDLQFVNAELFS